jgi:hypothetical protein
MTVTPEIVSLPRLPVQMSSASPGMLGLSSWLSSSQQQQAGMATAPSFSFQDVLEQPNKQDIKYRRLSGDYVQTIKAGGKEILQVTT